jgi:hypothetical protein
MKIFYERDRGHVVANAMALHVSAYMVGRVEVKKN